jgi:23S rRNA pseudouridine1911/1915/1917 synthase
MTQDTIDTNKFYVDDSEANLRLDKLLSNRFNNKSRSYFQYLIENKSVLVNGKNVKKRMLVKPNDEIELFFIATKEIDLTPEAIFIDILFEDNDIIVINKKAGMVVHPAPGNWSGTFVNALLHHCNNLPAPDDNQQYRPGIVHRLDKDTTGVLIAAKSLIAHQKLIEMFSSRMVKKEYLAICLGNMKDTHLSQPIGRHPVKRKEMCITPEGKEAISSFEVLSHNNNMSLVLAKPTTGRTHQIRVHLKHLNMPILGDMVYGSTKSNNYCKIFRQQLHCYKMEITHPTTNKTMIFTAPVPCDMKKFIANFNDISL